MARTTRPWPCFVALVLAVHCVGEPEPLTTLISRALEAHQRGDAAQAATLYDAALDRETELTPTVAAQLLGNAGALALVRGAREQPRCEYSRGRSRRHRILRRLA